MATRLAVSTAIVVMLVLRIAAQDGRPLPDETAFLNAARENLARAQQQQYKYGYKERRAELYMNPFGRLGSGDDTSTWEVTPGKTQSEYTRRLVEREGQAVTDSQPERQERRMRQGRSPIDDAASVLTFTMDRRETRDGRSTIVFRFRGKPEARPQTREGRIAKSFTGFVWVDEELREVTRAEGTTTEDISYGFGLIARLNKGTHVTLVRQRIDDHIWLPTSLQFKGHGRAMLFRRLDVDHLIEWFDYKRVLE